MTAGTPLRACLLGSDTLLMQCGDHWRQQGHRITAVATDAARVRRWAEAAGLPVRDAAGDLAAVLADVECDFLLAITWLHLVPPAVLAWPRVAAINFHDGPLPRYAGLNAPVWALLAGEREHGVTWHRMAEGADTGPILVQRAVPIRDDDTALSLNVRCFAAGLESFAELVRLLERGGWPEQPQDLSRRTVFGRHRRPSGMAVLDWRRPAGELARQIRALDHGPYRNPVGLAWIAAPHGVLWPGAASVVAGGPVEVPPGTVLAVGDGSCTVATVDGAVRLSGLRDAAATPLTEAGLQRLGIVRGAVLPSLAPDVLRRLTELDAAMAPAETALVQALQDPRPVVLPDLVPATAACRPERLPVSLPDGVGGERAALLWLAFLARTTGDGEFDVGVRGAALAAALAGLPDVALAYPPLRGRVDLTQGLLRCSAGLVEGLTASRPAARSLRLRHRDVLGGVGDLEPAVRIDLGAAPSAVAPGTVQLVAGDGATAALHFDAACLPPAAAARLLRRFARFAAAACADPDAPLASLPLLDPAERERALAAAAGPALRPPAIATIHGQFVAQAARTPDRAAVRCGEVALSYRDLDRRSALLAAVLRQRGAGPGRRVGVCLPRGVDLLVALLAVLRSGASYLPLDPTWPAERLRLMADDTAPVAVVQHAAAGAVAPTGAWQVVAVDAAGTAAGAADAPVDGDALAYVVHTSGSTGRPKGVMVRHRNVTAFFAGMDALLRPDTADGAAPGTWLSVTSPSFDISVLELLWTVCRGFTVVVWPGAAASTTTAAPARCPQFSLFYFASDAGDGGDDARYRLLLDGARFADGHGLHAVWTPERHFHAFGGLYPNPAVAGAAVAAITTRVRIRAGSVVLPLHHPARIAEEWALVDNLSGGRVDVAFASGWMPDDFVLRPEGFAGRKTGFAAGVRAVQALWRGETRQFPGSDGKPVSVRTLPRPVQRELPTWVTIAGNPDTFRAAGELGANVLTHLLGQSPAELADKLAIYRRARAAAGHAGPGHVTLMLHTFVGPDADAVRAAVRGPMLAYLRSSVDIVRAAAWSFPAFKTRVQQDPGQMDALLQGGLSEAEMDALLEHAFQRYYGESGLFGTPAQCAERVAQLAGLGVDEIACLIDFGVPAERVLQHLPFLAELQERCREQLPAAAPAEAPAPAATIPALLRQHAVTHLQCTPSLAAMLLQDPDAAALGGLRHLLVGGEALPPRLARQLRALVPAVHNMYGPTETTVWSSSWPVSAEVGDQVSIGRPLPGQSLHVLDACLQPVADGEVGEIWIGGVGVTAGYWQQPELTTERFRPDPFAGGAGVLYRTGDLGRRAADGTLQCLGRVDGQVKVRGHRLELGEIEAVLAGHPQVGEAIVLADKADGEVRLLGCVTPRAGAPAGAPAVDDLRAFLRERLPEFMVPAAVLVQAALPLLPNGKVDRAALLRQATATPARPVVAAEGELEQRILAVWRRVLDDAAGRVGVQDNFFDVGGHSILAVRVHRELQQELESEFPLTDLFRLPTVRALARHLGVAGGGAAEPTAAQRAHARAQARRSRLGGGG